MANDLETLRAGRHTIHLVRPGCPPRLSSPAPTWPTGWSRGSRRWSGRCLRHRRPRTHNRPKTNDRSHRRALHCPRAAQRRRLRASAFYFPELDGLRFVAFMMVYLFHQGVPAPLLVRLIGRPVGLAFVLQWWLRRPALLHSERIPDHLAFAPRRGALRPDLRLRAFWIRRILRIWPLYYLIDRARIRPAARTLGRAGNAGIQAGDAYAFRPVPAAFSATGRWPWSSRCHTTG